MVCYDGDGNLTNLGFNNTANPHYTWDDLSRLTFFSNLSISGRFSNAYDGLGRRVRRSEITEPYIPKTFFIYDGDLLIGEVQVSTQGAVTPSAAYTWGAAGLVSERRLATATSYWYHFGPQGETRQLSNALGTVTTTSAYTPYGVK